LWVASVVISSGSPGENASEAECLAYIQKDTNTIIVGGFLFMLGCLAFLWFAVVLRERLAAAEGGSGMLSNVAFVGAAAVGAFMMLTPGPEIAAAIIAEEEEEVSASAAAAMRMLPEAFLVAAAISAILLMLGGGIVALGTRIFPKVWAWCSFLLALLLVIPPIGWAALLLGLLPVWIVTTVFLLRRGAPAVTPVAQP